MFQVLAFVYENYWQGDACPEPRQLGRRLSAAGFEQDEILQALLWLDDLELTVGGLRPPAKPATAADTVQPTWLAATPPSPHSLRVYSIAEQTRLGAECLSYLRFLESVGVLSPTLRELVVERAMAASGTPVTVDQLKIIVLMVCWRLGTAPDALVLDELCHDRAERLPH